LGRGLGLLERNYAYLLILPSVAVLLATVLFPTIFLYYVSLLRWGLGTPWEDRVFVGASNYAMLMNEELFWNAVKISTIFVFATVVSEFFLGLGLALLFKDLRARRLFISFAIIPIAMTPAVVGLLWSLMYNSLYGVIPYLLNTIFGISPAFLDPALALFSVVMVDIWQWTPFIMLILLAGLESLPLEPYEAAMIDGATRWQTFRRLTIPMLRPAILVAVLIRTIDAAKTFDTIYVLTGGGPGSATDVLALRIFKAGFWVMTSSMGEASAIGVFLLVLVTVLSTILVRILRAVEVG